MKSPTYVVDDRPPVTGSSPFNVETSDLEPKFPPGARARVDDDAVVPVVAVVVVEATEEVLAITDVVVVVTKAVVGVVLPTVTA